MRFRVLGAVELVGEDGSPRALGSPHQRRILAALLASVGTVVPVDALLDALWGDDPPRTALPSLRTYVSRLRREVGPVLVTRGAGYALDADPGDVDAGRFEALVDAAGPAGPADAVQHLDAALALWRGPAFGDLADLACVRAEARRLGERWSSAREARAAALLAAGRPDEAIAAAEAVVASEPLREGGWATIVEALAAAARPGEALRAFQRACATLAESGLEPSPRLREAERAVLDGRVAAPPVRAAPAARTAPPARARPRVVASSFVGRGDDPARVHALCRQARVVTLVGPGGVGKTRLALETARVAADAHALGAVVVELAAVEHDDAVADAVVAALGVHVEGEGALDALDRAGRLDLLVVIDNAEHVVGAVAATVERLLAGGDALCVLTTSRERLGVDGEHVWTVHPLSGDGRGAPAARLFVDRARAVAPDAVPDEADERVARLVRRLDGLPLAIEMAAGQLGTVTLDELVAAIDLRLDTLRSPRRHEAARHRSLAAVLAWSESRLAPAEAAALADLSVFVGPFTAQDATGVLGTDDAAALTRELAERSLVVVDRTVAPARFRLLQTVRDLAAERRDARGRTALLARRHAEWYCSVAGRADAELRTADEAIGHRRLADAFAELRAAHRWARGHDPALAGSLTACLHLWGQSRHVDEVLQWAEAVVPLLDDTDPARPVALASAATRAINRGDLATARVLARRGVDLAGRTPAAMAALEAYGDACLYDGDLDESRAAYDTLVELAAAAGDRHLLAVGRSSRRMADAYSGRVAGVGDLDDGLGDDPSPSARGWVAYARGELLADRAPDEAFAAYDEALANARAVSNRMLEGVALVSASSLRARVGDVGDALRAFDGVIRHWQEVAADTHQLTTLRNLVVLLRRSGAADAAAVLLGATDRPDVPTYGDEADRVAAVRAWAEAELGRRRFEACRRAGAALDVAGAASYAREVIGARRA